MSKPLQKKMINMRLRGTSCAQIAQQLNLNRSSVALWLDKNGYTAQEVLHHHGVSTKGCKPSQISGMMTALLKANKPAEHVVPAALQEYLLNPNSCEQCEGPIVPNNKQPAQEIKKRRFCSLACSNKNRARPEATVQRSSVCKHCDSTFSWSEPRNKKTHKIYCSETCKTDFKGREGIVFKQCGMRVSERSLRKKPEPDLRIRPDMLLLTKAEIFSRRSSWQSARSCIQEYATKAFWSSSALKQCLVCGYTKHIEVCHIKSVASFDGSATLKEMSDLSNLVGLCPTHHGEFDDGVLDLNEFRGQG